MNQYCRLELTILLFFVSNNNIHCVIYLIRWGKESDNTTHIKQVSLRRRKCWSRWLHGGANHAREAHVTSSCHGQSSHQTPRSHRLKDSSCLSSHPNAHMVGSHAHQLHPINTNYVRLKPQRVGWISTQTTQYIINLIEICIYNSINGLDRHLQLH